jgi:putative sigma-54 modulation protein
MNITITARKFKAHDTLKTYINDELENLKKYNDDILDVDVILSYQNNKENIKSAELVVLVPGQTLTSAESSDDFKKAVNAAVDKLARQLVKLKTKRTARA